VGSRGTGNFSDYSDNIGEGGGTSGSSGGSSGSDRCTTSITATLEESHRCTYFTKYKTVPPPGTPVNLHRSGRVGVETDQGELIGFLPTQYNYLVSCMRNGYSYSVQITSSAMNPLLDIQVEIRPV
jgi:hypothetical protein